MTDLSLPPFQLRDPHSLSCGVVLSSPHSGQEYPEHFRRQSRLGTLSLRRSEDSFVDDLFAPCVDFGVPLLAAVYPRAFLDLNREPYELDPLVFNEELPPYANRSSDRVLAGLGTIARVVASGMPIYRRPLTLAEGLARINHIYFPYHAQLTSLLDRARNLFGRAILLDCHSMPSGLHQGPRFSTLPDIVLGNRHGRSCSTELISITEAFLSARGYRVTRNTPYAGGFSTQHYGQPTEGIEALQLEINRRLYMNETTFEPAKGFDRLSSDLVALVSHLSASCAMPHKDAAE